MFNFTLLEKDGKQDYPQHTKNEKKKLTKNSKQ